MPEHRLVSDFILPRPLHEVFAFFSDVHNLERITPPWLNFSILTRDVALRDGALIDYRIRLRGLPMRWRTRIALWEPPHRFVDEQLRGPYRLWHHTHEFTAVAGGTRMVDTVRYALPLGPLGSLAHRLFVRRDLERIFAYRRERFERFLGPGASPTFEAAVRTPEREDPDHPRSRGIAPGDAR